MRSLTRARIASILDKHRGSKTQVAQMAGVKAQSVSSWVKGQITSANIAKCAQVIATRLTPRLAVKSKRTGKPRRGPWRSPAFRAYVRIHPCVACQKLCGNCGAKCVGVGRCVGVPVDACHTENNGMSSKGPDSSCAPGCRKHHREFDAGRKAFEAKYGVDMKAVSVELFASWCAETGFDPKGAV